MKALRLSVTKEVKKSKLGGLPDMPAGLEWPKTGDDETREYLPFLCQIDLSEFQHKFAASGMLYFFCTLDPDDIYGRAVLYYDGQEKLESRNAEVPTKGMDCDYPLEEYYLELDSIDKKKEASAIQLFGKGDYIQSDLEEFGEEISGEPTLLLQLDAEKFDYTFGNVCGDCGRIYFVMSKEDLANKNFTTVFAEMQYD